MAPKKSGGTDEAGVPIKSSEEHECGYVHGDADVESEAPVNPETSLL